MTSETAETHYYTVLFQTNLGENVWLFAANNNFKRELTEDEAREVAQRCQDLGLGVRVHLHTQRVSKQLVMEKQPK